MDDLSSAFVKRFRAQPRIFRAPGRVNLVGEHTDYNEGFVMPAALEFTTRTAIAPRDDRSIEVFSINYSQSCEINLDEVPAVRRGDWSDYIRGVVLMQISAGLKLRGANIMIEGDVPIGSGLSSSAALEVATALALLGNAGLTLDPTAVALLCQRAENEFVGARTGIMDQFIACHGQAGHALLLDCRSLEAIQNPLPDHVRLVICDTRVKHELAAGEYNLRRAECERGVEVLGQFIPGLHSLRDVSLEQLQLYRSSLDPVIFRRCRHVITENARVQAAGNALDTGDLKKFGRLMDESHRSLRDDFEVSCEELDLMVRIALDARKQFGGVYGARMTGGGFGGSTLSLVEAAFANEFADMVGSEYQRSTGKNGAVYICVAADGAREEREK
jgi:galactokinase